VGARLLLTGLVAAVTIPLSPGADPGARAPGPGLTSVAGIKVGHYTLAERPTGCTVVLVEEGAVAGVDVRGSAPGTRETDLLNPVNTVEKVHAIVLAGGSAFGLDAASGVVRYLEERGVGFPTGIVPVPIVPAAILFDLGVGDNPKVRPTADCGYRAAAAATGRAMKAGVGTAAFILPDGLIVAALAVVNAVGDIVDPATGEVVAGVRTPDGLGLADARTLIRAGLPARARFGGNPIRNTTLSVVATNTVLTKAQATKVAQMAQDGLARTISPVHTPEDGDTIFALATGTRQQPSDLLVVGALAADAVAEAVLRAARMATGIPGYPAQRDLRKQ
jgi:L-aminopeptidase/D-esterase-like protein